MVLSNILIKLAVAQLAVAAAAIGPVGALIVRLYFQSVTDSPAPIAVLHKG